MSQQQPAGGALPSALVVGVGEAGSSDHAVRAGLDLGARLNAKVHVVHAVRVPLFEWMSSDPAQGPKAAEAMMRRALESVDEHVRTLAGPRPDEKKEYSLRVVPGPPAAALLEAAREQRAGWIVLGDHRKRGLVDFGSTARAVLAKGNLPVWIQSRPLRAIDRILAPIDMSEDSLRALGTACALAKALGASVLALHFFDAAALYGAATPDPLGFIPSISVPDLRDKERIAFEAAISAFDWQGVEHNAEFLEGDPIEGILELSQDAELIVIGTHGRTGLASAVLGGVAHSVIKRSDRPVLAIPNPGRRFRLGA